MFLVSLCSVCSVLLPLLCLYMLVSLSLAGGPFCLSFSQLCLTKDPVGPEWSPAEHFGDISGGAKAQKLVSSMPIVCE